MIMGVDERLSMIPLLFLAFIIVLAAPAHAGTVDVGITMGKPTYEYCENLSYVIEVSEVTDEVAIVHITDQNGKKSQAIPIPIDGLQNAIRAPFPFEREVFPAGKFTVDVSYAGTTAVAGFELVETGNTCIPNQVRQIAANWISGILSDGFLLGVIEKSVDDDMIGIPFDINDQNIYDISIPTWVKTVVYWWLTGEISDDVMAAVFDYLLEIEIIDVPFQGSGGSSLT